MTEETRELKSAIKSEAKDFFAPDRLTILPAMAAGLFRLLHGTCRFTILGREHDEEAWKNGPPVLYTSWHCAFPAVIYHYRDRNGTLMISKSKDGEWAAQVTKRLGFDNFRGSPGKGGGTALRQLIAHIKAGQGGGFIADGSQGPARVAQKGILLLSRYTGAPLVPVGVAANPCWRFRSWDRTVLAKPFSRVVLAKGPPIRVGKDETSEDLERMRADLENTLNRLTADAERALGLDPEGL